MDTSPHAHALRMLVEADDLYTSELSKLGPHKPYELPYDRLMAFSGAAGRRRECIRLAKELLQAVPGDLPERMVQRIEARVADVHEAYQQGADSAHAGFLQVWDEALHGDIPKPGTLGDPTLERLYRLTEQFRADAGLGNMAHKMLAEECDDSDALLRMLGLDPEDCRTDGGRLNLPRIRERLGK